MNVPAEQQDRSPLASFKREMQAMVAGELATLLQTGKARARLQNAAMVAVARDPSLLMADRASLWGALRQCAAHGVVPDGIEAHLEVYNTKFKDRDGKEHWMKKVQYMPMIRGIVNRVLSSGRVKSFWAEAVYKGEKFTIDMSEGDRRPKHTPKSWMTRGDDKDIEGFYAVAVMENGVIDCEPMSRAEVMKIREVAKTKLAWDKWFSEKGRVAVMRRLSKRLPLSGEDMDFIQNPGEHDLDAIAIPAGQKTADRLSDLAAAREPVQIEDQSQTLDDALPSEEEREKAMAEAAAEAEQETARQLELDDKQ